MRKQKTKRSMMGISLLAVMGITLLTPGAGINEVNATSSPSDAGIEENAASSPSDVEMMNAAPTAPVAINSTAFPDDVFREWVSVHCDKDSDGFLSDAERSQCTYIIVEEMGITSLTGIELFPNLTRLECDDNNLSSLDVSNNTALTYLYCQKNHLSSLNVSNNTALENLACNINNISSLDVSNNTALMILFCTHNNLSNLDVSNNTALKDLTCYNNNISNLDISKNTALTELNCRANDLSSLDVSYNTALTRLDCSWNNISSLDVSYNTALAHLTCYNNNISQLNVSKTQNLEELYYNNNALCSLDLSKNTKLQKLISNTQIISVPMYKNGNKYYIDLSVLPLDLKKVSIDEASGKTDGATYDNTSGQINLSESKDVGDTVRYLYETNGPALDNTKMTVTLKISEVRDITEPTTEQPTTEQPATEQPSTSQPVKVEPAPTQNDNSKDPSPKTGDTAPLYPVIFLLLASFVGGMTLYIGKKQK